MKTRQGLYALFIPTLLAFVGCSSGEQQNVADDAPAGEVSAELGETSCRYAAPDVGMDYFGTIPEPGLVSPAGYSNPKCYKGCGARAQDPRAQEVARSTVSGQCWSGHCAVRTESGVHFAAEFPH